MLAQAPERILDAPEILDDYYLNLLDWSSTNILAVALGPTVYLWNADSGSIDELMTSPEEDNNITSVSWIHDGSYLAVGTSNCDVQLWDVQKSKQVRSMRGHKARVGALAWNKHLLSSGSRDSEIWHHDVRQREHHTMTLRGHQQEVCGLKWSADGTQLASGGNDNILNIWDDGKEAARFTIDAHCAAVKAVAWCPHGANLLASGGGTADRRIRFWNTNTGACLNEIDTGSQVCSLVWNQHEKELLSGHGFSQNQLSLWKYPSMARMADLTGHTSRVLHMAVSPDGNTVRPSIPIPLRPLRAAACAATYSHAWPGVSVTRNVRYQVVSAAADETLRFWRVFGDSKSADPTRATAKAHSVVAPASLRGLHIR